MATIFNPSNPNVTDELQQAGVGFGNLIEQVGLGVAQTMRKLDETGAKTATALANTLVDVIAVQETVYKDDGTIQETKTHVQQLPLLNFIDPPFYRVEELRLQGFFVAQEITTEATDVNFQSRSTTNISGTGIFGGAFGMVLGLGHKGNGSLDVARATSSSDVSTGSIRMNARIAPRLDVAVPKPRQAVQGPNLAILQGAIQEEKDTAGKLVARTMDLTLEYRRRDGTPIEGKLISLETSAVPWSFVADSTTDVDGRLAVRLRREFVGDEPDTSPIDAVVSARIGLVNTNTTVTF